MPKKFLITLTDIEYEWLKEAKDQKEKAIEKATNMKVKINDTKFVKCIVIEGLNERS